MSIVRLYEVLIASMARPAIEYKYFNQFLSFSLVFQLLSWTHKIRMFSCNVLCIRAANSALGVGCLCVVEEDMMEKE